MKKLFTIILSLLFIILNTIAPHIRATKSIKRHPRLTVILKKPELRYETEESFNHFISCFTNPILRSKDFKIKETSNRFDTFDEIIHVMYKFSKNKLFLLNRESFQKNLDGSITFNFDGDCYLPQKITLNESNIWWDFIINLANDYFIPVAITLNNSKPLRETAKKYLTKIYIYSVKLKNYFENICTYEKINILIHDIETKFPELKRELHLFTKKNKTQLDVFYID